MLLANYYLLSTVAPLSTSPRILTKSLKTDTRNTYSKFCKCTNVIPRPIWSFFIGTVLLELTSSTPSRPQSLNLAVSPTLTTGKWRLGHYGQPKLLATQQVQALGATETLPWVIALSDSDILEFVEGVSSTEYHYTGTCAVLPRPLGGVVDSNLNVHGIDGLRVVDASIMPLLPSAHSQATVYAIAEKVNLRPYA
ncbi:choline dehydrogenase [Colletotrichum filicis]|nr:choline dehydrogenase [Colletotrichum filicis]